MEAGQRIAQTIDHPVGTCAMGQGPDAVVDTPVIPVITSRNTNAPTIMIAEKAADMARAGAARRV